MTSVNDKYAFIPEIHLAPLEGSIQHIHLEDLGFEPTIYSSIAASRSTPLFTFEAIKRMRAEVADRKTLATHIYSDNNNPCVLRGHCPESSRFTYNAWTHPKVIERVNEMAGIHITPVYDYEIAHINIQLGPRGWSGLQAVPDLVDSIGELASPEELSPTQFRGLNWHKDSYPFVCILMLSDMPRDCGGNTVIRKADGSNHICDLPRIGHALVLQGGRLEHAVSPTNSPLERLTSITSYRPYDPMVLDTCVLSTVRAMSDTTQLFMQWMAYRMRVLADRANKFAFKLDLDLSLEEVTQFAAAQKTFLDESVTQMTGPIERIPTDARAHFLKWANSQHPLVYA